MKTVLITGATGLIGANIAKQLIRRGDRARAIVRKPDAPDGKALRALGVEIVQGDITDLKLVQKAAEGIDAVAHCAALRGIPGATVENSVQPNVIGTINTLTAAWNAGNLPVVQLLTSTFFESWDTAITEASALDKNFRNTDPYSLTKRLAYAEGYVRQKEGQDIRFMLPGAGYGTTPCFENGMFHPSFNSRIQLGIRGELNAQMPMPVPWVFADDCAWVCIAALDKGVAGERYMAFGRQQDVGTIAGVCNLACEMAGSRHRVEEVPKAKLDDPEILAKYGPTMTSLGKRNYPNPLFDTAFTQQRLGYQPTPLAKGLETTIAWMRENRTI